MAAIIFITLLVALMLKGFLVILIILNTAFLITLFVTGTYFKFNHLAKGSLKVFQNNNLVPW